jgi:hypothetical protein
VNYSIIVRWFFAIVLGVLVSIAVGFAIPFIPYNFSNEFTWSNVFASGLLFVFFFLTSHIFRTIVGDLIGIGIWISVIFMIFFAISKTYYIVSILPESMGPAILIIVILILPIPFLLIIIGFFGLILPEITDFIKDLIIDGDF